MITRKQAEYLIKENKFHVDKKKEEQKKFKKFRKIWKQKCERKILKPLEIVFCEKKLINLVSLKRQWDLSAFW